MAAARTAGVKRERAASAEKINEGSNSSLALPGCIFNLPSRCKQIVSGFREDMAKKLNPLAAASEKTK